jgi:hypothetical protein
MSWRRNPDGSWNHRPWWKVAINTVLRWFQPFTDRKWVVYTVSTEGGEPPTTLGYGFGRILHRKAP